ncbi:hypothetical protein [Azospirillum sp.]|uniref:hypothetical protein n=1 Tax=Azospirillum sp. TaxID=34012 RepID=UPI003D7532AD
MTEQHHPATPPKGESPTSPLRRLLLGRAGPFSAAWEAFRTADAENDKRYGAAATEAEENAAAEEAVSIGNKFRHAVAAAEPPRTMRDVYALLDYLHAQPSTGAPSLLTDEQTRLFAGARETVAAVLRSAGSELVYSLSADVAAALARAQDAHAPDNADDTVPNSMDGLTGDERKAASLFRRLTAPEKGAILLYLGLCQVTEDAIHAIQHEAKHSVWADRFADYLRGLAGDLTPVDPATSTAPSPQHATSTIPVLGMTFQEAADRVRELLDWNDASADRDENEDSEEGRQRAANSAEWGRIIDTMLTTPAVTFGDVLAKMERITCPILGAGAFEITANELNVVAADIARLAAGTLITDTTADSEVLAALRKWIEASKRCDELRSTPDDDPEFEAAVAAHSDAARALASTPAQSALGLAVKIYLLWQIEHGEAPAGSASISLPPPAEDDEAEDAALHRGLALDALRMFPALQILAGGDTTVALAALSIAPAQDGASPDAELLNLWETYKQQFRFIDTLPEGDTPERDAAYEASYATEDRIEATPARTAAGIAVKLRLLFRGFHESQEADAAVIEGADMPAELLTDCRERMLWKLVGEVDHIAAAPQTSTQFDTFADTVAAFEAEAPKPLCMPQVPTARMVEAATATGVSAEQARAIYTAMADAYRKERAA